ncbi:MAG: CDP-alcohol phosphatidyltransferase family protein [Desulfobacterales bacterium]|nr:CDP-alcohol phosphatidyltransferase family protein [Desulfobacterales bacterium]
MTYSRPPGGSSSRRLRPQSFRHLFAQRGRRGPGGLESRRWSPNKAPAAAGQRNLRMDGAMHSQPQRNRPAAPRSPSTSPTSSRSCGSSSLPLFVILLLRDLHGLALLMFVLAGISDGLDGLIARMFNQRSDLGAVLDPIADKLLLSAAYVSLGVLAHIPGWLAVVVISRDVLIVTGIAVLSFCRIDFDIRPVAAQQVDHRRPDPDDRVRAPEFSAPGRGRRCTPCAGRPP